MPNLTWIDVQTQLLSNKELRAQFKSNPVVTAKRLGLNTQELDFARTVGTDSLDRQADLLIHKRYNHVKKILPWTVQKLGKQAYSEFEKYAGSYWPSGEQYHFQDAENFVEWLMKNANNWLCQVERNRFLVSKRNNRFALHLVSDFFIRNRWRPGLQILIKFGNKYHEFGFHFVG